MGQISYVNGRYLQHAAARIHIEDRGYQFADGVYEVFAVLCGVVLDADRHFERLHRSLSELRLAWPMARRSMERVFAELIRRNGRPPYAMLYIQITRGVAPRNHAFPANTPPSFVATVRSLHGPDSDSLRSGVNVITLPDIRWRRPDIKSVSLLPNVLAKQQAVDAGAYEAWLVDDAGLVTEGTASNAWIVTADGDVVTHPADSRILSGIARQVVVELAYRLNVCVVERPFSVDEAKAAREAFVTGTTSLVKPVVRIDETPIGDGRIGSLTRQLQSAYLAHMDEQAGVSR